MVGTHAARRRLGKYHRCITPDMNRIRFDCIPGIAVKEGIPNPQTAVGYTSWSHFRGCERMAGGNYSYAAYVLFAAYYLYVCASRLQPVCRKAAST